MNWKSKNKNGFKVFKILKPSFLKNKMEIEATKSETKSFQEDVLSLQRQSEKLKSAMDEMVRINGAAAKDTNDYVALQSELARKLSDSATNFKPI
jgi:chemotaxis methyl-accepting protein methylase